MIYGVEFMPLLVIRFCMHHASMTTPSTVHILTLYVSSSSLYIGSILLSGGTNSAAVRGLLRNYIVMTSFTVSECAYTCCILLSVST